MALTGIIDMYARSEHARADLRHPRGCARSPLCGIEEPAAESIVEVVSAATSPLVTRDMLTTEIAGLRADMYRALWIQGAGIVAVVAGIIGITQAIG